MNISWPRCVSFPLEERVLKRLRLLSWWKCSAEWIKIVVLKMCLVLPCVEADRVVYPFCLWVVKVQIHIKDLSSRMSPTLEGVEIPSWKHKNNILSKVNSGLNLMFLSVLPREKVLSCRFSVETKWKIYSNSVKPTCSNSSCVDLVTKTSQCSSYCTPLTRVAKYLYSS